MDNSKSIGQEFQNLNIELSSIAIEEETQDLELSGFTTAASFSTLGCFIGGGLSSSSSLSSAGD